MKRTIQHPHYKPKERPKLMKGAKTKSHGSRRRHRDEWAAFHSPGGIYTKIHNLIA